MVCERDERTGKDETLAELVDRYIRNYRSDVEAEFERYSVCDSLRDATVRAAMSLTAAGTRHPHQRRFQLRTLEAARDALVARELQLASAVTFAELHVIIQDVTRQVYGAGPLYTYDVATRIGANRELWPEEIYLHAGTRKGARRLGCSYKGATLKVSELRRKLGDEIDRLQPYQMEDFLCIFADKLPSPKGTAQNPADRADGKRRRRSST